MFESQCCARCIVPNACVVGWVLESVQCIACIQVENVASACFQTLLVVERPALDANVNIVGCGSVAMACVVAKGQSKGHEPTLGCVDLLIVAQFAVAGVDGVATFCANLSTKKCEPARRQARTYLFFLFAVVLVSVCLFSTQNHKFDRDFVCEHFSC